MDWRGLTTPIVCYYGIKKRPCCGVHWQVSRGHSQRFGGVWRRVLLITVKAKALLVEVHPMLTADINFSVLS